MIRKNRIKVVSVSVKNADQGTLGEELPVCANMVVHDEDYGSDITYSAMSNAGEIVHSVHAGADAEYKERIIDRFLSHKGDFYSDKPVVMMTEMDWEETKIFVFSILDFLLSLKSIANSHGMSLELPNMSGYYVEDFLLNLPNG